MSLHVIYLRHCDPAGLLGRPTLAPLATLAGRGSAAERTGLLRQALAVISTVTDTHDRRELSEASRRNIHLKPAVIHTLTQEAGMPFVLDENTVAGRVIFARGRAQGELEGEARGEVLGEARGEERGRVAGHVEERVAFLSELMHATFGDDPRIVPLAERMAAVPRARAVELALRTSGLDDLEASLSG